MNEPHPKSTILTNSVSTRKTLTANFMSEDLEQQLRLVKKRDRMNMTSNSLLRTRNHVENIEHAEMARHNRYIHLRSSNGSFERQNSCGIGNSFQVKPLELLKLKPETSISLKSKCKTTLLSPEVLESNKKILPQNKEASSIKMQGNKQQLHFEQMSAKIGFYLIREMQEHLNWTHWCFIISQSIFYGSILSETNLLKLRFLIQNLGRQFCGIKFIVVVCSEIYGKQVAQAIKERGINVCAVIWNKQKYSQTINCLNLSQISHRLVTSRYISIEDQRQLMKNIYFQYLKQGQNKQNKSQQQALVDYSCKYAYIRVEGLANLCKICQNLSIGNMGDENIWIFRDCLYEDVTQEMISLGELQEKIKVTNRLKIRPFLTCQQSRQLSISKKQEKVSDLRSKLVEYATSLQPKPKKLKKTRESTSSCKPSKSLTKKTQKTCSAYCTGLVTMFAGCKDKICHEQSKQLAEIVQQLAKSNQGAIKQISKFRKKAMESNNCF